MKNKNFNVEKFLDQRVAIFIDTNNLYHSAKNLFNKKVNFKNFLREALRKRKLVRAIAYVITTKTKEEKSFLEALEKIGIETKKKELLEYPGGVKKANWDVGIAVDAIKISPFVDVIVLGSGDGDFVDLCEYLKNHGKKVEIVSFGSTTSSKLKQIADYFLDMEKFPKKFLL
jgi:uncharacterized LabA/DUF88 family protein